MTIGGSRTPQAKQGQHRSCRSGLHQCTCIRTPSRREPADAFRISTSGRGWRPWPISSSVIRASGSSVRSMALADGTTMRSWNDEGPLSYFVRHCPSVVWLVSGDQVNPRTSVRRSPWSRNRHPHLPRPGQIERDPLRSRVGTARGSGPRPANQQPGGATPIAHKGVSENRVPLVKVPATRGVCERRIIGMVVGVGNDLSLAGAAPGAQADRGRAVKTACRAAISRKPLPGLEPNSWIGIACATGLVFAVNGRYAIACCGGRGGGCAQPGGGAIRDRRSRVGSGQSDGQLC